MKKIFFLFLVASLAMSAYAQTRNVILPERPKGHAYKNYDMEDQGFWCAIEAEGGSSVMTTYQNMQYATMTFTGGYRISEYLKIGAGLGAKAYVNHAELRNTSNKVAIPIFANVRGNFMSAYDRGYSPYWSVNIGGVTNDGFYFSPSVGYSIGGLRNNFLIGISYTLGNFTDYKSENRTYSYFGVKLGYEF